MSPSKLSTLIPLGALAAGFSLAAAGQTPASPKPPERELPTVKAKATKEAQGKDGVQATHTEIGKGKQELRDIPQSITVVTEKLIDDRNLDTLKDVLRNTAGISFLAAEGGEEDVRLRGFPLQATGDVFVDGQRDPAFYERDTFFDDRVEVLRGSASMLFGRGSTGGAVNQVRKKPRLIDQHEVELTVGSHQLVRAVGDFNLKMGESSALRLGTMVTKADNDGAGNRQDKKGLAASWRTGIGERNEFLVSLYHLNNDNGMNYGMPWIRPTTTAAVDQTTLIPVDPKTYYGMASDRNAGEANFLSASHTHRFDRQHEITTKISKGAFERDQRSGTVRFGNATLQPDKTAVSLATFNPSTVITRGTNLKVQDLDTLFLQSDYSGKFNALGLKHHVLAGVDFAQEEKTVFAALNAAQGGVVPTKPTTTVATPSDGAWVDEGLRSFRIGNQYESRAQGAYLQDLVQVLPEWKLLLGLRYDRLTGDYDAFALPNNAPSPTTQTSYRMKISEWSQRAGVLFQPNERMSFHLGAATSFNTSGDAYSLSAANANIPPEQAVNVEAGAKIDSADGKFSSRIAVFRSTKLHERNTDPLLSIVTLSGKRHVSGVEVDLAGRLTPQWEVFGSYVWMPLARIDESSATGGEVEGARPSLTPRHSGSVWTTYQLTQTVRVGGGLNWRSSMAPIRNPGFTAPSFVVAEVMAEYQVLPNKLTLKGNISNVANKRYADTLYPGHYLPGTGRLFQLKGTYKF